MSVKEAVDKKIASKKVIVYSKSYCPYCAKAKKVFAEYFKEGSEDYEVIEIDNDPQCDEIQNYMQKLTGGRSVPRVFINGKFFGGGDDTVAGHSSGKLKALLA